MDSHGVEQIIEALEDVVSCFQCYGEGIEMHYMEMQAKLMLALLREWKEERSGSG